MQLATRKKLAKPFIFLAALIWGSSFFIVKNTLDVFPPALIIALRFSTGLATLALLFFRRLPQLTRAYLIPGAVLGGILFGAYYLQTAGMTDTSPGKNAFLTAIYCVLVPFLAWLFGKSRPDKFNVIAAVLCLAGIGLISLTDNFSIGWGDGITLGSGLLLALHIFFTAQFAREKDPVLLTIVQFCVTALLSWAVSLASEDLPGVWPADSLLSVAYLGIFATGLGLFFQVAGQKYADPSSAAILMSLESVFGVAFSVLFYGEQLSGRVILGFALVFVSVLLSETKLSFFKRRSAHELSQ